MPLTRGFDNLFIAADDDIAGRRALQRAREIRPDEVHLKFANGADANETIRQSGADTINSQHRRKLQSGASCRDQPSKRRRLKQKGNNTCAAFVALRLVGDARQI
jgi:DNA primase